MTKILVIDDEADTIRMLTTALGVFGFTVLPAYSGEEAVTGFQKHQPAAVVLDLMLPDVDGFEVARRLRALPGAARVPIVVLSATADIAAEEQSRAAGATHFFRKPMNIRTLAEALRAAIEKG
jgi:CheY-like chemotaxis protein